MQRCGGVSVNVRDKRKYAMLFQSVVLPCQYSSSSIQTPVVQWWYKSYCRDRTHDAFSFTENVKLHASGLGSYSNLDCSDSSRTVRIVASGQGSSMTLAEYYKGRDIAIINSKISEMDGLLPGFDVDFMPACSVSELSSLHDGEPPFRQTYRQVQKAALPPIADNLDEPNHRATLSSQAHKSDHHYYYSNHREEQHQSRWNPRSEHLQRKAFGMRSRTGSLDELEEFALSYSQRGRRGEFREQERHYGTELQGRKPYPPFRDEPHHYHEEEHRDDWLDRHQYQLYRKTVERDREHRRNHHSPPPPSPRKRQDTSDSELQCSRHLPGGQDYDEAYLTSLLERKARARGTRAEEDSFHSDTPSKGSSKKSSECYNSRSPSNRPEEDDSLPPYSERSTEPSARPFPHSRPMQGLSRSAQERREEREKARKVVSYL
ncbi:immunoglobulin-like domain-containing receptor 2-like [Scleropages formosus]|nr:immunoglobulin-like domain-containing receptor 2-like [Scleropages formosus]